MNLIPRPASCTLDTSRPHAPPHVPLTPLAPTPRLKHPSTPSNVSFFVRYDLCSSLAASGALVVNPSLSVCSLVLLLLLLLLFLLTCACCHMRRSPAASAAAIVDLCCLSAHCCSCPAAAAAVVVEFACYHMCRSLTAFAAAVVTLSVCVSVPSCSCRCTTPVQRKQRIPGC